MPYENGLACFGEVLAPCGLFLLSILFVSSALCMGFWLFILEDLLAPCGLSVLPI